MAGFNTKTFDTYDHYMTPFCAWKNIDEYLPKDRVVWEAFFGDATSGTFLEHLGCTVVHRDVDFFHSDLGDVIVSNPPFSQSKPVLQRLRELDKPFIVILPVCKMFTQYFRRLFGYGDPIQIIIPRRRIQFVRVDGTGKGNCNFDCFYYCWKMNLPRDIIFLDDAHNSMAPTPDFE